MNAIVFPGQGCQRQGMGRDLYQELPTARDLFERANQALGRRITDIMFDGSEDELLETRNTQPAVFLYSTILALSQNDIEPDVVAGHSLGEFSALVVSGAISFEDGLNLVLNRALIAQKVCESQETAMAAVIGLADEVVEECIRRLSAETGEPVYFANHNGPGQVVITGSKQGIRLACKAFKEMGAKKAVPLPIGGSFHSPFMREAGIELSKLIESTPFQPPRCPVVQCVDGKPHVDPSEIRDNLCRHITHSVLWTSMVHSMQAMGVQIYYEAGPNDTLQKILQRMCPNSTVLALADVPTYKNIVTNYKTP